MNADAGVVEALKAERDQYRRALAYLVHKSGGLVTIRRAEYESVPFRDFVIGSTVHPDSGDWYLTSTPIPTESNRSDF